MTAYETVIGLEIHVELATKSKIFCSCSTTFGADVNTQGCPVCLGLPGALPVINEKVVEFAAKAGLATNCRVANYCKMDRKNYFYPDLPKAYQISQYDLPICEDGWLDIEADGTGKRVGIIRIHMEEDAGKLTHNDKTGHSYFDVNRCGVPLLEIVTQPHMNSAAEAKAMLENIKEIMETIGVSDCKMEEGSLRCDVNLSVRPIGQEAFGTRTETKNLNSFRSVVNSISFEEKRQIRVLETGGKIIQETRRWDDELGVGYSMRSKENEQDYRYFPEPDLVPIVLPQEKIDALKESLPELPAIRRNRYKTVYGLSDADARQLVFVPAFANFLDEAIAAGATPKAAANFLMVGIPFLLKENNLTENQIPFSPAILAELIALIENNTISSSIGSQVLAELFSQKASPKEIIEAKGWSQVSDTGLISQAVAAAIAENPQSAADYKSGKGQALGFLVGQVMRATGGKANPKMVNEELKKRLS